MNDLLANALRQFDIDHNLDTNEESNTTDSEPIIENVTEIITPEQNNVPLELNEEIESEATVRFSGASWYEWVKELQISLIGLGGIGSWTIIHLARLQPAELNCFDPDTVEEVNLAGQLYANNQIGISKIAITRTLAFLYGGYSTTSEANFSQSRVTADTELFPICISGVDNMAARKVIFYNWKKTYETSDQHALFIDARMSAEQYQIFSFDNQDKNAIKRYEKEWLFDQRESEAITCSFKQTSYCAGMIGGMIINVLINHISNWHTPVPMRNAPFMTAFDANTLLLKTQI